MKHQEMSSPMTCRLSCAMEADREKTVAESLSTIVEMSEIMRSSIPVTQIPAPKLARSQNGVGLIEVMVAALILAISVLGLIAMQLKAVRISGDSQARVQATAIAQDLIERMTMNDRRMMQSADGYSTSLSSGGAVTAPSSLPQTCLTAACTPAQTVAFDVNQAAYYASTLLPNGLLSGRVAASGSKNLQVFVSWGGTKPVIGTGNEACMEANSGETLTYRPNANCVMLEATFQ